jgi:hypothetical protein
MKATADEPWIDPVGGIFGGERLHGELTLKDSDLARG